MTWIQTLNGRKFDLLNPDPACIDPVELATVLSRICRFGGHCREWYSVAQHSVLVCDLVSQPVFSLPALLHDAHEAYWGFGDVCRPAKSLSHNTHSFLHNHQTAVDVAVAERFGFELDWELMHCNAVKLADNKALATEARDLMGEPPEPWVTLPPPDPRRIVPLSSEAAKELFLTRLNELWSE